MASDTQQQLRSCSHNLLKNPAAPYLLVTLCDAVLELYGSLADLIQDMEQLTRDNTSIQQELTGIKNKHSELVYKLSDLGVFRG